MLGTVIDEKYRILGVVGEGGMSSIYEAEHIGLDRRVAIKVLHPSLAEDPEAIARLRHEAQVVSTIGHPNICEVFDLGRTESRSPYLVMELLVGESLAERLKARGAMQFLELAPLLKQVLAALQSAHDKGILHRDLKPENVFVESRGRRGKPTAKLLDFGISKSMSYEFQEEQRLTHTGMVMGTPYYMAPEQARGDSGLDQRVDLWAVGVMMYEALSGRRPFVATNYNALLVKILTSRPRPIQKLVPTVPDVAAAIIDRALSKLREDRFQSAREFLSAVSQAQRACMANDLGAPTMVLRRPPHRSSAEPSQRGPTAWEIEDPSTFIDDDLGYDPSQIAGPVREYQPPAPVAHQHYDFDADPVEPTVRERAHPGVSDADVLHAPVRQRLSSAPDSARDTEVIRRAPLFHESEKTELVLHNVQEGHDAEDSGDALDRPTFPMPPPKPVSGARPVVPRPVVAAEDDEKTTLFNPERARALRAQASRGGGRSDEPKDE